MTKEKRIAKVMKQLYKLQEEYPEVTITVETPNDCSSCRIGDAIIYDTCSLNITFDAE